MNAMMHHPLPALREIQNGAQRPLRSPEPADTRVQRMAQAMPEVCWLFEPQADRFVYVTPACERRWGTPPEALYRDPQLWLSHVHVDDRAPWLAARQQLARGVPYVLEYRSADRHGAPLWIAEEVRFLDVPRGAPPQVMGISRDVTAYRRAEQRLQDDRRRQDEFLAILAHELRTPLQSLLAAASVLSATGAPAVKVIERQVLQMSRMVDDLGEFTGAGLGRLHLQLHSVALRDLLRDTIESLLPVFDAGGLHVRLVAPAEAVRVRGDAARLLQVFGNLLHNAAKFSAAGGDIEVVIVPSDSTREVTVSVRDEGAGIAADVIDSVFDLFVQEPFAPARLRRGLGIGLAVVRNIAERHGGRVSVHSDGRGTGSRFDVTLPMLPTQAGTPRARRVLIVEDNADAATTLMQLLQLDGHEVTVASTGREALRQADLWQPDVVIMDVGLPDLDGCEVARRLRASKTGPVPRLIALSGACGEAERQAMRTAGFDHWLVKPAAPAELSALLDG